MLRATTEAMSAVLGGADSIYVAPFDECYKRRTMKPAAGWRATRRSFSSRKRYLARVADAGGGSYYLEALTHSIAQRAWKQLQEIEAAGGFRKATRPLIEQTLERRKAAQDKSVIAAATRSDRHKPLCQCRRAGARSDWRRDRARLGSRRRCHSKNCGCEPSATPVKTGKIAAHSAGRNRRRQNASRALGLCGRFLACAGLATDIRQFETPRQIAAADADLIVLCSSDAEYLALATDLLPQMKSLRRHRRLYSSPAIRKPSEQLRAAGVTEFIHLRSNPIEVLTQVQQLLGIGK